MNNARDRSFKARRKAAGWKNINIMLDPEMLAILDEIATVKGASSRHEAAKIAIRQAICAVYVLIFIMSSDN